MKMSFFLFSSTTRMRLNSKRNLKVRCRILYTLNLRGHKCLLIKPLMFIIIITVAYLQKPLLQSEIYGSPAEFLAPPSSVVFVVTFPPDCPCLLSVLKILHGATSCICLLAMKRCTINMQVHFMNK